MEISQERHPLDERVESQVGFVSENCHSRVIKLFRSKLVLSLLLGQALSGFICGTAVTSEYLNKNYHISLPLLQSFLNYSLLAFIYGAISIFRLSKSGEFKSFFRNYSWKYFVAALIDVEANFMIIKAYQYTSVTSVQLIDCLTIPTVLLLSRFVFRIRFNCTHYIGVLICISGVGAMLTADFLGKGSISFNGSNPILGDVLVAAGASLYGVSNVAQEYLIRERSKIEYLGWLGTFSTLICGIQMAVLEGGSMSEQLFNKPTLPVTLCFIGFTLCMFALYSLMPWVMEKSSAVVVNLSLLTADIYALIVGLFLFRENFHDLYYGAYILILIGVFTYVIRNPKSATPTADSTVGENGENETCIK